LFYLCVKINAKSISRLNRLWAVVLLALAVWVAPGLEGQVAATPTPKPLTAKQTLRVLLANRDVSLNGNASCLSVISPGDKTVGDYLATMFSRLAEDQITWRSEVTFREIGAVKQKKWQVRLSLYGSDAADTYDTGVTFGYNAKNMAMIPGSFQCSGTS
jgi:hypothetical protein